MRLGFAQSSAWYLLTTALNCTNPFLLLWPWHIAYPSILTGSELRQTWVIVALLKCIVDGMFSLTLPPHPVVAFSGGATNIVLEKCSWLLWFSTLLYPAWRTRHAWFPPPPQARGFARITCVTVVCTLVGSLSVQDNMFATAIGAGSYITIAIIIAPIWLILVEPWLHRRSRLLRPNRAHGDEPNGGALISRSGVHLLAVTLSSTSFIAGADQT